jgi:Carboxypeptidase regulatory-like domain
MLRLKVSHYVSICLFFALPLMPRLSYGQERATIVGTVTDSTGAVLPGADVVITNSETGISRKLIANRTGDFNAPDLNIGTYSIDCKAQGFKEFTKTAIPLNVNDTVRVDVRMEPGATNQSVTVTANALQVQSDSSEISYLISGQQVSQLDINGRNVVGLTALGPGVTTNVSDFVLPTQTSSTSPSFNGMGPANNRWIIDGSEAYDRGDAGDLNIAPSPDALAEFKVLSSNYTADYGFGSGGTIDMVLKSGTRDFHGGLWEYLRNDALDANSYFSNLSRTPKPELRFNTFGGNLGGPVFIPGHYNTNRSRTFFFVNEEDRRIVLGGVSNSTVPTVAERAGDFSALTTPIYVPNVGDPAKLAQFAALGLVPGQPFPGNNIPSSLLDPNVQLFLGTGALPVANSGSQYITSANQTVDLREDILRIDEKVSDKIELMGHYMHDADTQFFPAIFGGVPTVGFPLNSPAYNAVIRMTYIFSPNLINVAAFNFNNDALFYGIGGTYKIPSGWTVNKFFAGNDPTNRMPTISWGPPYNNSYQPGFLPYHNDGLGYTESDDLSWTKGAHNFKFGGSFLHYTKNQVIGGDTEGNYDFGGSYTAGYAANGSTIVPGNSFADMLLGMSASYSEAELQDTRHYRQNFGAVYVMDNWHANRRLTLNLGLRYEALPRPYEKYDRVSNFIPSDYNPADAPIFNSDGSINANSPGVTTVPGVPLSNVPFYLNGIQLAGRNGFPSGLGKNDWTTIQPRVGFAYDLYGNGRTILRSGAGLFFDQVAQGSLYNAAQSNPPFSNSPSVNNVYFSNPKTNTINGQTTSAFPILPNGLTSLAYDYPVPETAQYSLGIEQQLSSKSVFTIGYVGNASWHQYMQRSIDTVPLADPNRLAIAAGKYSPNLDRIYAGYSGITQQQTSANANYSSLQTTLRTENLHGLTLQLAYTWSKAMNIQTVEQQLTSGPISDPFNPKFDYGPSDLDQQNVFVASYIYKIPFGSSLSNGFARQALGGWQISGVTNMKSGMPFTPTLGFDNLGLGGGVTARPDLVKPLSYSRTRLAWFGTDSYATPAPLSFGDSARNSIRLPGRDVWNLALFKTFALNHEGMNIQFRADSYNTFNHTQFQNVDGGFNDATFGQVTSTWDPRVLQLSLRFGF